jgi:hypothetical protein
MSMGQVVQMNRHARRARHAVRKREDRCEGLHVEVCKAYRDAERRGARSMRVSPELYHNVHRVLGEPSCPLCPTCVRLRREGRIDSVQPRRTLTLAAWSESIARCLREQAAAAPKDIA